MKYVVQNEMEERQAAGWAPAMTRCPRTLSQTDSNIQVSFTNWKT